jgi:hypothetical protein
MVRDGNGKLVWHSRQSGYLTTRGAQTTGNAAKPQTTQQKTAGVQPAVFVAAQEC